MELTGSQILIESLLEQDVEVIFGYPGGNAINIYDALWQYRDRLRHVLASHEQGAAHAADGYARATGRVGVCMATSGPGATNLVTGIATAYLDSIPMVAITANVPRDLLGRDTFQEVDITGVTVPITKHNYFVWDSSQLAATVREAFEVAASGRPGPVLIDIPKDVTGELLEYRPAGHYELRPLPQPKEKALSQAVKMLEAAEKPLICFGGGVLAAGAEDALQHFAQKAHAPLVSTSRGLSAVPYNFPLYMGLLGMHGTPAANYAVSECDLLITVGARFSDRVTGSKPAFAKNAKIIHIDIDPSELGKNIRADCQVVGDAKEVLDALTGLIPQLTHSQWGHSLLAYRASNPIPEMAQTEGIDPRSVLGAIRAIGGASTLLVTDVGQHQMIAAQHYKFSKPRTFLSSLGLGTMGYGMGAAVGAKIGCPGSPVALVTGDGCFHMNMNELAVAVTEQLPMVIVIMNNGVLGMVRQWQKLFYQSHFSATTLNRKTDFVKLAEAMGAKGVRITQPEEVKPVLEAAFAADGPVVIDCIIDPGVDVFPIIPPGGSSRDMIYME